MICPNCGTNINEGERFCTECGTPVNPSASQTPPAMQNNEYAGYSYAQPAAPQPPKPEKPKAGLKKTLGIVGICAAAVVVIALLVGVIFTGGAKNQLRSSFRKSYKDLTSIATKAVKGTELTAGIDFAKLLGDDDIEMTADVSVFASDKNAAVTVSLEDDDNTLDFSATVSEKALTVASSLLDGKAYGVNIANLAKNLKGSILDPDSDSPVALGEEEFEALIEALGKDNSKTAKELEKSLEKVMESFDNALWKSLKKNADIKTGKEKVDFGEDVKVKCISITIDQDGIAALAADMIKWAQDSKELEAFIDKAVACVDAESMDSVVSMLPYQYRRTLGNLDLEDAKDNFYDALDEMSEEIDDLIDEIEDTDIEIVLNFYINGSKQLVGIACEYDVEGMSGELEVVAGPRYEDLQCIRVSAKSGKSYPLDAEYTVSQNDSKAYKGKLSVKTYKNEVLSAKVDYSKKSGDFKLSGKMDGDEFSFECSAPKKGSVYTISGIKLEYGYIDTKVKGLSLTLDTNAKAPSQPKYTEVLSLDMDDIKDIAEEVMEKLEDFEDGTIGMLIGELF
ncbi:MAG: zinc ribbon domain-containing protein [Oscillospiraceae bacterium]|nr:zinc ribbon domain-containing protein [Oscillospiraceae bacterium]